MKKSVFEFYDVSIGLFIYVKNFYGIFVYQKCSKMASFIFISFDILLYNNRTTRFIIWKDYQLFGETNPTLNLLQR